MGEHCFLFVAGTWTGGWIWDKVIDTLRVHVPDARVHAITLPSVGAELGSFEPSTSVQDHGEYMCRYIDEQGLKNIIIVAHSYGGFPSGYVAEHRTAAIKQLVYIDALVPAGVSIKERMLEKRGCFPFEDTIPIAPIEEFAPGLALGIVDDSDRAYCHSKFGSHPVGTYATQPSDLGSNNNPAASLPAVYLKCDQMGPEEEDIFATDIVAATKLGWEIQRVKDTHYIVRNNPEKVVDTILKAVRK